MPTKRMSPKLPSKNAMLLNGGVLLVAGLSVGFVVRSAIFAEAVEPCSGRYEQGTRLTIDRPLTGADLQARFGGTDWGVLERARVVKLKSGPAPFAVELDLTASKADDRDESNGREGVGFQWAPRGLTGATAACLAYAVFLPEGFEFGAGGRLPGLMGQRTDAESPETAATFSTRYAWRENGQGDIHPQIPTLPEGRSLGNDRNQRIAFERGRWVGLEQELVLNGPGLKNGVLRVWVDGELRFEKSNVVFRERTEARITGVMAEAVHMGRDAPASARAQKLWVTPFELRWR